MSSPFAETLYTSEEHARAMFKKKSSLDFGSMFVRKGRVIFRGNDYQFEWKLRSVRMVAATFPLGSLLAMLGADVIILGLSAIGFFKMLTLDSPVTYIMIAFMNLLWIASEPWRWVRVTGLDEDGDEMTAYFAAGPMQRLSGGTRKIYRKLKRSARPSQKT